MKLKKNTMELKKDAILFTYDNNEYRSSAKILSEKSQRLNSERDYFVTGIQNVKKMLKKIYDLGYNCVFLQPVNYISKKNFEKMQNCVAEYKKKFKFISLKNHLLKRIVENLIYDRELFKFLYYEYKKTFNIKAKKAVIFIYSDKDRIPKKDYLALNYIFQSGFLENVYFCSIYDDDRFDKIVCQIVSKGGYDSTLIPFTLKKNISDNFNDQLDFSLKHWLETREIKTEIKGKTLLNCEFFLSKLLESKKIFKKVLTNEN